jgi:hypothetical protein
MGGRFRQQRELLDRIGFPPPAVEVAFELALAVFDRTVVLRN